MKEITQTENSQVVAEILQNRNDRLNLNGRLLEKDSRKYFEKPFALEKGSVDISLRNNYYLGRASSNLELFVAINNVIIENVPIGLRSTPYHFHIEGLNTDDLVQAGIRATVDMGSAWIAYSIVALLEWTESPETSESKLSIGSTKR